MGRVVIKKPNRMKLVPLGESEPPNLQLFPPISITGTHNRKMELIARISKAVIHKLRVLSLLTIYIGLPVSHVSPAFFVSIVSCFSSVFHDDKRQEYKHMKLKIKNCAASAIYFDLFAFQFS